MAGIIQRLSRLAGRQAGRPATSHWPLHSTATSCWPLHSTSAGWGLLAPLAAGLALRLGGSLEDVAVIAEEAHHVVEVEAISHRTPIDGAARMATAHSCTVGGDNTHGG